jgi:histidine triad (HIT) family protein
MSCIFCRIAAGEIPAEIVAKDEHTVAFLDITPLADGHTVVIPRRHVATIEEMDRDDAAALFHMVRRLAGPVRQALGAAGSTIGINNGGATGQTIPHVHVHIVPRWENDGAGTVHTIFPRNAQRDIKEVGTAIRAAVAESSAGIDVARGAD